eukprot:Nitzschia sp. Nitz4//scaffold22_size323478//285509//289544//NITZ4_000585-RA/size323478-processed-gene-0.425-mRNA-1//1//CDS//3329543171//9238//frame0
MSTGTTSKSLLTAVDEIPPELQALDETLRCKLCGDHLHAAVSISSQKCGHSFCSECIRNTFHAQLSGLKRERKCPICRFPVTSLDVDKILVRNRALQEAVEAFQELLVQRSKMRTTAMQSEGTAPQDATQGLAATRRSQRSTRATSQGSQEGDADLIDVDASESAASPIESKLPMQNYSGKNKKKLQELCRRDGLPTTGTEADLKNRHQAYVTLYNSEFDAVHRRTPAELVEVIVSREKIRRQEGMFGSQQADHAALKQLYRNGGDGSGNTAFDQKMASGFSSLIQDLKQRMGASKKVDGATVEPSSKSKEVELPVVADTTTQKSTESNNSTIPSEESIAVPSTRTRTIRTVSPLDASPAPKPQSAKTSSSPPKRTLSQPTPARESKRTRYASVGPWNCPRCTFYNEKHVWSIVVVLQKWLISHPGISAILPEAAMVLGLGMIFGFFIHLFLGRLNTATQQAQNNAYTDDNADDYYVDDDANQAIEMEESDLNALLSFSPSIFFVALLPPILFNSGLRVGALFFRHIIPISLFAVLGTTISAFSTALLLKGIIELGLLGDFNPSLTELLCFGSLISSTDPISTLAVFQAKKVDPQLFYLVFGESALNDALAIVLFDSFSKAISEGGAGRSIATGLSNFFVDLFLNSVGSIALGAAAGLCTAYLFKQLDLRQNRLLELSLYLLLVYIPFLLAEVLQLSGIVTILFTGIAANRYVVPNLSSITEVNADMLFRLMAHLAETSIFLELGLSVFGLIGHWNWTFIGYALLSTLVARALNIFPLSILFNRFLLHDVPEEELSVGDDQIMQFRRAFSPIGKRAKGGMLGSFSTGQQSIPKVTGSRSFSEQSQCSVITATPINRKDLKIRPKTCAMLWYSGLRGAVSYACARTYPEESQYKLDFTVATMALVVITVFILGGTTELALNTLNINVGVDEDQYMKESLKEPVVSNTLMNFERRYIFPMVVRDFHIMHGITHEQRQASSAPTMTHKPATPHVEMTESFYLDNLNEDPVATMETMVRQDTLFDYGG